MVYAALLRGINVGGKSNVSMADLKKSFENLGFQNVRTYINSGNVIFNTRQASPRNLESKIEAVLEKDFGFRITVVVASQEELRALMSKIPSGWKNDGKQRCNVIFLRHEIDSPDVLNDFAPKGGIDEVHYLPGVLLWASDTANVSKSSLHKIIGTQIYKQITIRNLNTVRKIYELMLSAKLDT